MKADEVSLARLMAMSQAGDRQAYATLLDACQRWLRGYYACRIAPSQLDDLVQDTLMALHNKRASWDSTRPFLPWLAAIARYRWVDHLRKLYRAGECELGSDYACHDDEPAISARITLDRLLEVLPDPPVDLPPTSANHQKPLLFRRFWAICVLDLFTCVRMHPDDFGALLGASNGNFGGIDAQRNDSPASQAKRPRLQAF